MSGEHIGGHPLVLDTVTNTMLCSMVLEEQEETHEEETRDHDFDDILCGWRIHAMVLVLHKQAQGL